jgi:glyoxalase family protein
MGFRGNVIGSHHVTFCVGGAQDDYDFHVRTLGLRSVKKTVLFDGEIPIYHLYYGNGSGDVSTLLTSFPYRQAGWKGKPGTNQLKVLNLQVPVGAIGYWADRLKAAGIEGREVTLFGTQRLAFKHPCGIDYALVAADEPDPREPWEQGGVPGEYAIRGSYGTTTSVADPGPMEYFLTTGIFGERAASEGPNHQFKIGTDEGQGRYIELVEEPALPQGSWTFGEGTIHHHALDVGSAESQAALKDWLVGLGFTDASEPKDRGYFFSVYLRSPSGALIEFAYSTPAGFTIDESREEFGTHMCIPPHWENRRSEIAMLEPLDTIETMVA